MLTEPERMTISYALVGCDPERARRARQLWDLPSRLRGMSDRSTFPTECVRWGQRSMLLAAAREFCERCHLGSPSGEVIVETRKARPPAIPVAYTGCGRDVLEDGGLRYRWPKGTACPAGSTGDTATTTAQVTRTPTAA